MLTQRQLEFIEAAIKLTATGMWHRQSVSVKQLSTAILKANTNCSKPFLTTSMQYSPLTSPRCSTMRFLPLRHFTPFAELFILLEHNTAFTLMLFAEETFNVDPQLRGDLLTLMEGNLSHLVLFFQKLIESGSCRSDIEARQLAVITFGSIRLTVSRWHLQGAQTSLTNQAAPIANSLITLFRVP